MKSTYFEKVQRITQFIENKIHKTPDIAVILGSGLGAFADEIQDRFSIKYSDIPEFPCSTVSGHSGVLHFGKIGSSNVLCLQGRVHAYEGHDLQTTTLPVRVLASLKTPKLIVTNAAGGVQTKFRPADLMLIEDHLNLLGASPLTGFNEDDWGPRFLDMSCAYSLKWRQEVQKIAETLKIPLQKGIYAALPGPSYETPAEIRMLRTLGADAVGMSTVPEVLVARHQNLEVLGMSVITNLGAGILNQNLDHSEVLENSLKAQEKFCTLLKAIISKG